MGLVLRQHSSHPPLQGVLLAHKTRMTSMRLLLALLLPWLQFFTIGRPFAGLICLVLQVTIIGWIPAAIWSVYALSQYKTDQKIARMGK
ncbi:hypothetical protein ATPR_0666 [Acetobacter tropicalis NBRC 101654]|nr:hypothetical protein ATPR_0666 [Acetobacter tropicalis NBRC 101654]